MTDPVLPIHLGPPMWVISCMVMFYIVMITAWLWRHLFDFDASVMVLIAPVLFFMISSAFAVFYGWLYWWMPFAGGFGLFMLGIVVPWIQDWHDSRREVK